MGKFNEKKWFIGGDLSKDTIDFCCVGIDSDAVLGEKCFENNLKGYEALDKWLKKKKISANSSLFCFEHTGAYGLSLFSWLSIKGYDYCVEPALQIKRSIGMTRGKNDKVDARRIAVYAQTHRAKLQGFEFPASNLLELKQLLTYRDQLVRTRSSFKNSYKSHKKYEEVLRSDTITKDIEQTLEQLESKIQEIEREIMKILKGDQKLMSNFQLATSVGGIGLVIAAFMLVTTNNFTSFDNGRKYACYAGIAPFEHSSGKFSGTTRVNHLANKKLKTLLSNGANSAKSFDPEIKAYYLRKKKEGKDHKLIINAISCKLVNRVFAVIKRGTPYVSTYGNIFVKNLVES